VIIKLHHQIEQKDSFKMDTHSNDHQGSSTIKANEKKQSNGFLCFSCLGKGRPPSSLIPEEISSVHNGNDKDSVHHQPTSNDQPCTISQSGVNIKNDKSPCDNKLLNGQEDNETNEEICQKQANNENIELQSAISENPGCSINSITVTNTTSPSHMSLSQAPTNTISSQLSAHRFPSTGLSSPPPPLKCAFLVRYFASISFGAKIR